jgi:hypothetical protein
MQSNPANGMSFCLYGAAAAYQATQDPKALELAQRSYRWIDEHAHDIETAYLMLQAEDILGHGHDPRTEQMAKMLVDHGSHTGGIRLLEVSNATERHSVPGRQAEGVVDTVRGPQLPIAHARKVCLL